MTATASPPASGHDTSRFLAIDGLRGVAAMMVTVAHLFMATEARHPDILGIVPAIADYGRYGVQIFFVLSGFVIAHSVRDGAYSFAYLGRFAGRRFVRLDMPYWLIIGLEVALLWLSGKVMAAYAHPLPSWEQILANAFYVQTFLGYPHILDIFWTLCYEIQFYLVLVSSLCMLQWLRRYQSELADGRLRAGLLSVSFLVSLLIYVGMIESPHPALFVDRWFQFALGVITYLSFRRIVPTGVALAANAAVLLGALAFASNEYRVVSLLVTAATSLMILFMNRTPRIDAWLSSRPLQFLGAISYSLYLVHLPIGWRAVVVVREMLGGAYNAATALFAFAIGVAASVFAAWLLFRLVEKPAMLLARRINLPKRAAGRLRQQHASA